MPQAAAVYLLILCVFSGFVLAISSL